MSLDTLDLVHMDGGLGICLLAQISVVFCRFHAFPMQHNTLPCLQIAFAFAFVPDFLICGMIGDDRLATYQCADNGSI